VLDRDSDLQDLEISMSHLKSVRSLGWIRIASLVLVLSGLGWMATAISADGPNESKHKPQYNSNGELLVPKDYRSWIFVGTNLSPVYKKDLPGGQIRREIEEAQPGSFHQIYINPEAYRIYLETQKFPDSTMLIMEVYSAGTKDTKGFLTAGKFEEKRVGFEMAVKDSGRPGGGVPWAYYNFKLDQKLRPAGAARAKPDGKCYDCHLKHAGDDNVWVQFYPVLRDRD
jgi:hypothetical protein